MEDHSGVADRTDFSVDSAVARVKGKHHDGDVLSWMAFYAIKSGGTAKPFRPVWMNGLFLFYSKKAEETAPSYYLQKKIRNTKEKKKKTKEIKNKNQILLRRNSNVQQSPQ